MYRTVIYALTVVYVLNYGWVGGKAPPQRYPARGSCTRQTPAITYSSKPFMKSANPFSRTHRRFPRGGKRHPSPWRHPVSPMRCVLHSGTQGGQEARGGMRPRLMTLMKLVPRGCLEMERGRGDERGEERGKERAGEMEGERQRGIGRKRERERPRRLDILPHVAPLLETKSVAGCKRCKAGRVRFGPRMTNPSRQRNWSTYPG